MADLYANLAKSTLAAGISSSATSLTVATGDGSKFPSPSGGNTFPLVLDDGTNLEITTCTARTGDVLTVSRAQESTTAMAFSSGAKVELRITAGMLSRLANPTVPTGANPTASVGLLAVNGSAATFMRSDAAPALDQGIAPTWTASHVMAQAVAASGVDFLKLKTTSTATLGNQKWSGGLNFEGSAWNTTGGVASTVNARAQLVPIQGAAYNNMELRWSGAQVGGASGGAYVDAFIMDFTNGRFKVGTTAYGYSSIVWGGWGNFINTGSSYLSWPGDVAGVRLGLNAAAASPIPQNLQVQNASGTNTAGATPLKIICSLGTGNANSGGVEVWTGDPGASGSTLQTASKKLGLDGAGLFDLANTTDATSSTAASSKTAGGFAAAKKIIAGAQIRPGTYTVATLPAGTAGDIAYASDARKVGEGAAAGTGSHVLYSNGAWRIPEDQSVAAA